MRQLPGTVDVRLKHDAARDEEEIYMLLGPPLSSRQLSDASKLKHAENL